MSKQSNTVYILLVVVTEIHRFAISQLSASRSQAIVDTANIQIEYLGSDGWKRRRRHHTAHDRQISHSFRATHSFNMHIHFIPYQPMSTTRDYENWLKNGERDAPKLRQLQKSSTSRVFWWCPINCRSFWCIVADDMRLTNLYYEGWWLSGNPMVDVCGLWIRLFMMLLGRRLNASGKWADFFNFTKKFNFIHDQPTEMIRVKEGVVIASMGMRTPPIYYILR